MSKVVRRKSGEASRGDCWVPHSLPLICEPDGLAVWAAEEHIFWLLARSLGNQASISDRGWARRVIGASSGWTRSFAR